MKIKIKMNQFAISALSSAADIAIEKTAEAVKTDVIASQVMPFDLGTMQNESVFVEYKKGTGKASIIVDTPYARRLYFHPEYNFRTDKNPNARGQWFEPWIEGENKDFAKNAFINLYKRSASGVVK